MGAILGIETGVNLPDIEIAGFFSSTWIYIAFFFFASLIACGVLWFVIYNKMYKLKVILYENLSGGGFQPIGIVRARIIKLSELGDELIKTTNNIILPSNGKKTGKGLYSFCKGEDGYWYNIIHGDFDAKRGMLDIEVVDRDVRGFYVATQEIIKNRFKDNNMFDKVFPFIIGFILLVIVFGGFWMMIGKNNKTAEISQATSETNKQVLQALEGILASPLMERYAYSINTTSGVIPAT
jgi:hypothetical protein